MMGRRRAVINKTPQPEIPSKVWSIAKRRALTAIDILRRTPEIGFSDLLSMMYVQGITDMGTALKNHPENAGLTSTIQTPFPEIEVM